MMYRTKAQSIKASATNSLVEDLQHYFVYQLEKLADSDSIIFEAVEWFRDEGRHGGGVRYVAIDERLFNRASVNVSQVHYDDDSTKHLASATALSTIIHPQNPYAPSVHMHISWTEMRDGKGYWRLMADLNPAIENKQATEQFNNTLKNVLNQQYKIAVAQGERYFYIPALERHRGVSHFYLEEYRSGNEQVDFNLARNFGQAVIDCYVAIFQQTIQDNAKPTEESYNEQLAYHTLYLFQVLTLDRGTTSGLLVHKQNDVGIMGSLPAEIDKALLASWQENLASPQDQLLAAILDVLPDTKPCLIDEKVKLALADVSRKHYKANPRALALQAQGNIVPPTVQNHN